jgi:hypothetical protein
MSFLFLRDRIIKKCYLPHTCVWCGEKIDSKQPAINRAYIFEGDFNCDYLHPECNNALVNTPNLEDGFGIGQFKRGSSEQK